MQVMKVVVEATVKLLPSSHASNDDFEASSPQNVIPPEAKRTSLELLHLNRHPGESRDPVSSTANKSL